MTVDNYGGGTPAGWYDDGQGYTRWWDGARWTEHTQPAAPSRAVVVAERVPPSQPLRELAQRAGWYPNNGVLQYFDGRHWTQDVRPLPGFTSQVIMTGGGPKSSGISTGAHVIHGVMSLITLGMWVPIWILHAVFSKRKYHY